PTPEPTLIPTVLADTSIVTDGRLEPVHFAELALSGSGLVTEVLVKEGDQVKPGQVLARLEGPATQTIEEARRATIEEVNAAYEAVRQAQYALDNFDIPKEFEGMTPNEAVEAAIQKVNEARAAFEPYEDYPVNDSTRRERRDRLDDAWSKYRKAIQWLDLTTALEFAQARLADAQADLALLNDPNASEDAIAHLAVLANAELRAPFAGTITSLRLKVGEYATAGQDVVTLADLSGWVVKTTDLTEIDVVKLGEGQPVTVKLDALPDKEFNGNILFISQTYSESQGDIVYEVTILLTETDPLMRWGMTAEVKFE
ncbi:MAG: efflux RND transporter periplasmic adaptor subunit, partial [Chloroflexota bacterium]